MQTRLLLPVLFVLAACVALTAQPTDDLYQARLTADSLFKKGKYPEAYLMVEDALKKTIEKDSNYADLRGIKAACHIYLKQYDEALAIYPEIMPLIAKYWGPNSLLYGKNLYLNGTALNSMWNSVAAEEKFLEAMPILEKTAGRKSILFSNLLNNLSAAANRLGEYEYALKLLEESVALKEQLVGKTDASYHRGLRNVTLNYIELGLYDSADSILKNLLDHRVEYKISPAIYRNLIETQGIIHFYKHNYERAELIFRQNLNFDLSNSTTDAKLIIRDYTLLSLCELYSGRPAKCLLTLDTLLTTWEKYLPSIHLNIALHIFLKGDVWRDLGQPVLADSFFTAGCERLKTNLLQVMPSLSEQDRTWYMQGRVEWILSHYYSFVEDHAEEMPGLAERMLNHRLFLKNILLRGSIKLRNQISKNLNPAVAEDFEKWKTSREQLTDLLSNIHELKGITIEDSIRFLNGKIKALEKNLATQSADFTTLIDNPDYDWKAVRAALRPGEAAIEVVKSAYFPNSLNFGEYKSTHYLFFIITPESVQPRIVVIKDGDKLENELYTRYRLETTDSSSLPSVDLWQAYFQPLVAVLERVKTVYFSPDGIYNKLNPNTLRDIDGNYLLDLFEFRIVDNLSSIQPLSVRQSSALAVSPNLTAALFGDPSFNAPDKGLEDSNRGFSDLEMTSAVREIGKLPSGDFNLDSLPYTREEVENIGGYLKKKGWKVLTFLGEQATEEEVKNIQSPGVLHLATHGLFLEKNSSGDKNPLGNSGAQQNPLFRSVLFFSGAQNTINAKKSPKSLNDGLLTAFEAMNLQLDGTELVVLSACKSGLGQISGGQGVYGLPRAFRIAGAKSILFSLWNVDDRVTKELMTAFYENWLSGINKRAAFRQAQLQVKARYPQPFYWGGFILVE